jgi:hypothetical protein
METKQPTPSKASKGKGRGIATFVAGLVLGAVLMALARPFLGDRLPSAVGGKRELVQGPVAAKQRQGDRLLLTVVTPAGAVLGTFKKKVEEIDLLVETGDTITLAIGGYQPFLDDPEITRVAKPAFRPIVGGPEPAPGALPADSLPAPADTATDDEGPARKPSGRWY